VLVGIAVVGVVGVVEGGVLVVEAGVRVGVVTGEPPQPASKRMARATITHRLSFIRYHADVIGAGAAATCLNSG
jgi:hypothetical protein